MLDIKDYIDIVKQASQYPKEVGLAYCTLGLSGEFGELIEVLGEGPNDSVVSEVGDCFWYCTALAIEVNKPNLIAGAFPVFERFLSSGKQVESMKTYLDQTYYIISKLSEKVKKHYRDGIELSDNEEFLFYLFSALMNLMVICHILELDIRAVFEVNYNKLVSRGRITDVVHDKNLSTSV